MYSVLYDSLSSLRLCSRCHCTDEDAVYLCWPEGSLLWNDLSGTRSDVHGGGSRTRTESCLFRLLDSGFTASLNNINFHPSAVRFKQQVFAPSLFKQTLCVLHMKSVIIWPQWREFIVFCAKKKKIHGFNFTSNSAYHHCLTPRHLGITSSYHHVNSLYCCKYWYILPFSVNSAPTVLNCSYESNGIFFYIFV